MGGSYGIAEKIIICSWI